MTYKKYKLEDICEFIKNGKSVQQTKDQKGLPITRIETIANSVIDPAKVGYANLALEGNESYLLKNGDILFSHINSVEHLFKTAKYNGIPEQLIHGMNLLCLRPNVKLIDPQFFLHLLRSDKVKRGLLTYANKSVNQASISATSVKNFEVDIPSLEEQRRIASILDKADDIRQKRQQAIAKLDKLLQATFIDMFGDPVSNPKNWPKSKIGNICDSKLGKMLDKKKQSSTSNQYKYLRNANIQWFSIDTNDLYEMEFDENDRKKYELIEGDVLVCEGGEPGRAAIWRNNLNDCYFQKALHRVRLNQSIILPEYFVWIFWFYAKNGGFNDYITVATIAHLTGIKMKDMEIPIAPLDKQEAFIERIKNLEKLKSNLVCSQIKVDQFFHALQQKAFNGTL